MKTMIKAFVVFTLGSAAFLLLAQSDADYQGWMKTAAAAKGKMEKGVAAKDGAVVTSEGMNAESAFKQIEAFWQKRGVSDAATLAKTAHEAAAAASKAAAAGNFDQAGDETKKLSATCGACHMAHREKGDSGFKIKQ